MTLELLQEALSMLPPSARSARVEIVGRGMTISHVDYTYGIVTIITE